MASIPSATTWGSPSATKHALLIHGLTSSSHTWQRVASALAAQGYLVTAPNLIGHGFRTSTDYRVSSFAQDLRAYLDARNYSLIIGHSMGGLVALALLPHLPPSYPTAIVLIDPPLQLTSEKALFCYKIFTDSLTNPKQAEAYCAENPLWEREDGIVGELGTRMCYVDTVRHLFEQNKSWDFLDYLKAPVSSKWRVTALLADPTRSDLCSVDYFHPYPHIRTVVVPGVGHWIQYDAAGVVIEEALKTVAGLEAA